MKNTWIVWIVGQLRNLGPYLAVELILPGGSLLALLLWLYRHRPVTPGRGGAQI